MSVPSLITAPPAGLTLLSYHRMDAASGLTETDASGNSHSGTYSASGVTLGVTGALTGDSDKAVTFDGTAGQFSVPLDLSAYNKISLLMFLRYNASVWQPTSDRRNIVSYGSGIYTTGGFIIATGLDANANLAANMGVSPGGLTRSDAWTTSPPTVNAFHLLVVTMDRTQTTAATEFQIIVDGVTKTLTTGSQTRATPGNFGNLTTLSVAGPTPFAPVSVDELAVFSGIMTPAQALAIYNAAVQAPLPSFSYTQNTAVVWPLPFTASVTATANSGSLSYVWTLPTKPASSTASVTGSSVASVSVTPDLEGTYGMQCVCTDTGGSSQTGAGSTVVTAPARVLVSSVWKPAKALVWNSGSAIWR